MKKLSIQSKKNALRYLAAVFAWTLAIAMLPVAKVQAAGFSGNGFDISSHNGVVDWNLIADADLSLIHI